MKITTTNSNHITRYEGKQRARSAEADALSPVLKLRGQNST